jgi:hypothetical protein
MDCRYAKSFGRGVKATKDTQRRIVFVSFVALSLRIVMASGQ